MANLNDFNDIPSVINETEFDSIESTLDIYKQQQNQQSLRPVSAASSTSSSSGLSNDVEMTLKFLNSNGSSLCDNYLEQSYIQLKILCIEQIKKPGKDHTRLFQLIHDSHLTLNMRQFLTKELVFEAARFRRSELIQLLRTFSHMLQRLAVLNTQVNAPKTEAQSIEASV